MVLIPETYLKIANIIARKKGILKTISGFLGIILDYDCLDIRNYFFNYFLFIPLKKYLTSAPNPLFTINLQGLLGRLI